MNPADDRPINSSGNYNTVDANERTVRSMADSKINPQAHTMTNPASLAPEDRPIRASGAYNY